MRTVTWLHISDFHIKDGDAYDRNTVLNALVGAVRNAKRDHGFSPDMIFATGDIAFSGTSSEYGYATAFFDAILEAAGLEKSHLFVISGNHDVDREWGQMLQRTLKDDQASIDFFGNHRLLGQYLQKQQAFREWHTGYFSEIRTLAANTTCEPPEIVEINGLRVAVSAVNSALFCQGDDDHGKLWIGTRCLDLVADEVQRSDAHVRICLVHHPLEWLHDGERSVITTTLNRTFDVILRGHLHETDALRADGAMGNAVHIACGAAYQGSQWPNRVLFARADFDAQRLTIRPIRYEGTPHRVWSLDTSLFSPQDQYEGHIAITWKGTPPPSVNDGGG